MEEADPRVRVFFDAKPDEAVRAMEALRISVVGFVNSNTGANGALTSYGL